MEKISSSSLLQKQYRKELFILVVFVVATVAGCLALHFKPKTQPQSLQIGVEVQYEEAFTQFLKDKSIAFQSKENTFLQLDHYNPEKLSLEELESRFLPQDDRMTPFLKALPNLFYFEKDSKRYRLYSFQMPLTKELKEQWYAQSSPHSLLEEAASLKNPKQEIFFYIVGALAFLTTLIIQRFSWRQWGLVLLLFGAAIVSGRGTLLWAVIFISNVTLWLWRQWQPHREYWWETGVSLISDSDRRKVKGEIVGGFVVAIIPTLFLLENLSLLIVLLMGGCGFFWFKVQLTRGMMQTKAFRFVFKPMSKTPYRRPLKAAELVLGILLFTLTVGMLIFSTMAVSKEGFVQRGDLSELTYEEAYQISQKQPQGTLNAVGYLQEKIFQYCYRYEKVNQLPPPDSQVTIDHLYYHENKVYEDKIVIERFTEQGFNSIIKRLTTDPLSIFFFDTVQSLSGRGNFYWHIFWVAFTSIYFVFLLPFFQISKVSKSKRLFIKLKD